MSEPKLDKSNSDLSSNSSWSVIEESENSKNPSLENILDINDNECLEATNPPGVYDNSLESTYINIPDSNTIESKEESMFVTLDAPPKDKSHVSFKTKCKKKKRKAKADPLSLMAIAASLLTITGISLLCMLFPQDTDNSVLNISNKTPDVTTDQIPRMFLEHFEEATDEDINRINGLEFLRQIENLNYFNASEDNEICSIDDVVNESENVDNLEYDFIGPGPFSEQDLEKDVQQQSQLDINALTNVTNQMIKNIRTVLGNTNLQVFLCTLMQDVCLIKLVNQLNKSTENIKNETEKKIISKRKAKKNVRQAALNISNLLKKKPKAKKLKKFRDQPFVSDSTLNELDAKESDSDRKTKTVSKISRKSDEEIIQKLNERYNNTTSIKNNEENGKSECERRFEQLDNQWEFIGQNHRQKIQEIREKFRTEVFFVRDHEKEASLRRHKIEQIREKYIQRLKNDRERYLMQLRKLREERQKVLKEICHQKKTILDLRDTGVGNYAVLLPGSYDFEEKLRAMKVNENNFIPLTPRPRPPSGIKLSLNLKTNNALQQKSESDDSYFPVDNKRKKLSTTDVKKRKPKKAKGNSTIALIENMVTDLMSKVSIESAKAKQKENMTGIGSGNRTEEYRNASAPLLTNNTDRTFKVLMKNKYRVINKDLYDLAFGEKGNRIKKADERKWYSDSFDKNYSQLFLSKQDPQRTYKEKIIFKGQQ